MNITKEKIKTLYDLSDELEVAQEVASEQIRTVQDQHGQDNITIFRDNKYVVVKEADLWKEVYHLGTDSPAGKALAEKHPDVFKSNKVADDKADEFDKLVQLELGINFRQMKLTDFMKLMEGMLDYKLGNTQTNAKSKEEKENKKG